MITSAAKYFEDYVANDPMMQFEIRIADDEAYWNPPPLEPDVDDITDFVEALFAHADEGTFVSLRSFLQSDRGVPPPYIRGVKLNGAGHDALIDEAVAGARFAANAEDALVFAPPIATFRSSRRASEEHLANAFVAVGRAGRGEHHRSPGASRGLARPRHRGRGDRAASGPTRRRARCSRSFISTGA